MKRSNRVELYYVVWEDHYSPGDKKWMTAEEVSLEPLLIETVGWLVGDDGERIAIVPTMHPYGETIRLADPQIIIKSCIRTMRKLNKNPKARKRNARVTKKD